MPSKKAKRLAWGKIKPQPNGTFWAGEPMDGEPGKYRPAPRRFRTRTLAEAWLREREQLANEGKIVLTRAGDQPFRAFYVQWLALRYERMNADPPTVQPKTYQDYESVGRNYLLPLLGDSIVRKIDVVAVKEFQEKLRAVDKNGERIVPERPAQKAEQMASWVLNFAVREGAISINPFRNEKVVRNNKTFHRSVCNVTSNMVEICAESVGHNWLAIYLGAYVGLRAGEVWGLTISSPNVFQKRLTIAYSLTEVNDKLIKAQDRVRPGVRRGLPKPQRQKVLDIPDFLIPKINQHLKERGDAAPDDWLFVDPKGLPVSHTTWYNAFFTPAMAAAAFPPEADFHTLRHFCGSWYLGIGYPAFIVQKMLDHTDAEMTRLYSHILPGMASAWHPRADSQYAQERAAAEISASRERLTIVSDHSTSEHFPLAKGTN